MFRVCFENWEGEWEERRFNSFEEALEYVEEESNNLEPDEGYNIYNENNELVWEMN